MKYLIVSVKLLPDDTSVRSSGTAYELATGLHLFIKSLVNQNADAPAG